MFNGEGATLPGGYWSGTQLEKDVIFRPLNGYIEQTLSEAEAFEASTPRLVSRLLGEVIEKIGDTDFGPDEAASLCIADRQWLMLQLATLLNGDRTWLTSPCKHCESTMDIPVNLSELPVTLAGKNFPHFRCRIGEADIDLRVPTGADQEMLTGIDEAAAPLFLLERCVVAVDGKAPGKRWLAALSDEAIESIEAVLEEESPSIATTLALSCPECGKEQHVTFNPYGFFYRDGFELLDEIHVLALHYHWSERDILNLPRTRRRSYLKLIERSIGMEA